MADFKDRLWRDLVRERGAELDRLHRPDRRRPRRRVLAAGAAGLAAAATALLVALGTSGTSPAFAVQRHANGTVTVTINRLEGIRGANARLEKLGINVRAVPFVAGCPGLKVASAARARALQDALSFARGHALMSVGIDPRRLRPGKVVVLAARPGQVDRAALVTEVRNGPIPPCAGNVTPVPPPGGGKVVCHTFDGKTPPLGPKQLPPSAAGNSGTSGATGDSGTSASSGAPGSPRHRGIICQARVAHPGSSGHSGSSGESGVTGNR